MSGEGQSRPDCSAGAKKVVSFYRFLPLPDFADLCEPLLETLLAHDIRGTILLAGEGINGSVSGSFEAVEALKAYLGRDRRLAGMEYRETLVPADAVPFHRTKVKLRRELVSLGVPGLAPHKKTGRHVLPRDWNALIADPEITLIDTRNQYETAIGGFPAALDPKTGSFRDFPDFVKRQLDPQKHPRVAMFCTGGIRCEKASAHLLEEGFEEVFQLQGGLLGYLAEVPKKDQLFTGECFVFDNRVSLGRDLAPGSCVQCFACRHPLSEEEQQSPCYEPGVSCPHCHGSRSPDKTAGLRERQKQMALAKTRKMQHPEPEKSEK